MCKGWNQNRVTCYLQIDFDNAYIRLSQKDTMAAEDFARHPAHWLRRLEDLLGGGSEGESVRRDILVRRCYLNPATFGRYRQPFVRAGFEVVDCPVLTGLGKTAADMSIAADMLEAVHHSTRFDEFILLSGDADFTPVLHKLRLHDRRTIAVTAQKVAASYAALCDRVIGPGEFRKIIGPDLVALPSPDDAA